MCFAEKYRNMSNDYLREECALKKNYQADCREHLAQKL